MDPNNLRDHVQALLPPAVRVLRSTDRGRGSRPRLYANPHVERELRRLHGHQSPTTDRPGGAVSDTGDNHAGPPEPPDHSVAVRTDSVNHQRPQSPTGNPRRDVRNVESHRLNAPLRAGTRTSRRRGGLPSHGRTPGRTPGLRALRRCPWGLRHPAQVQSQVRWPGVALRTLGALHGEEALPGAEARTLPGEEARTLPGAEERAR